MADFLPQTVLNVNYGRQGRAVFQLTTPLHFVCRQMVQNTCTQSHLVQQWRRTQYWFFSNIFWLLVWKVFVVSGWGGVGEWGSILFPFFPGDHPFIREPSGVVVAKTCWGRYNTQLSTVLLEQSSQKYERGYGFIKSIWLSRGFYSNSQRVWVWLQCKAKNGT